jgi:hypothetical protein
VVFTHFLCRFTRTFVVRKTANARMSKEPIMANQLIVQQQIDVAHDESLYALRADSTAVCCRILQVRFAHEEAANMDSEFEALAHKEFEADRVDAFCLNSEMKGAEKIANAIYEEEWNEAMADNRLH